MRSRTTLRTQVWPALLLIIGMMIGVSPAPEIGQRSGAAPPAAYIVQAASADGAALAVERAGGAVDRRLEIIDAVAATLAPEALARLSANPHVALHADRAVRSSQGPVVGASAEIDPRTGEVPLYPAEATESYDIHNVGTMADYTYCNSSGVYTDDDLAVYQSLRGYSVTVAIVDSGLMPARYNFWTPTRNDRGTLQRGCNYYRSFVDGDAPVNNTSDPQGHGTHVAYTIADASRTVFDSRQGYTPRGVAPSANLVIARALDADGGGSYASVIAAIDWIVSNKDRYNIRVLNLSLYAPVDGPYWADPLNQAVMRAWQAGIVVVTVAGNGGPGAGTITAPGNVPYVITVGALKSKAATGSGDALADFSARGPTESAFVKPDLVVPATRTLAPLPNSSTLAQQLQSARMSASTGKATLMAVQPIVDHAYYYMSGTSMAAAQVSGVVALMIQQSPTLTNDQIKLRLLSTATPAIDPATGLPIYTHWEQGAGRLNTEGAIFSAELGSANAGMDIAADLAGSVHYLGATTWDELSAQFQIVDPLSGQLLEAWSGGRRTSSGSWTWSDSQSASSGSWIWSGGRRTSSGSPLLLAEQAGEPLRWAGDGAAWPAQGADAAGGPGAEVVLDDGAIVQRRLYLPVVFR